MTITWEEAEEYNDAHKDDSPRYVLCEDPNEKCVDGICGNVVDCENGGNIYCLHRWVGRKGNKYSFYEEKTICQECFESNDDRKCGAWECDDYSDSESEDDESD